MSYQLFLRNPALERHTLITDAAEFTITESHADVSKWVLDLPYSDRFVDVALGWGVIWEVDGTPVFSGYSTQLQRKSDGSRDRLIMSGVDDTGYLARRVTYPSPYPFTLAETADKTGAAETVIKAYVNENLGPGAAITRRLTGLTIEADAARGSTVTGSARFDDLLALVQSLAITGGRLGFRIVQAGSGLEFRVTQSADLSAAVKFKADSGGVASFDYTLTEPTSNFVIAGGGGDGTARTFDSASDSASVSEFGRIEAFVDQRQTVDAGAIDKSINETLSKGVATQGVSIVLSDMTAFRPGVDFALGDIVAVEFGGVSFSDCIMSIVTSVKAGEIVRQSLSIGNQGAKPVGALNLFRQLRDSRRRIAGLEARK